MQLDVTDQESVDRLAKELGEQSIDVLINNAGILPVSRSVSDIDIDVFNRTLAVNTVGPVRVTQAGYRRTWAAVTHQYRCRYQSVGYERSSTA